MGIAVENHKWACRFMVSGAVAAGLSIGIYQLSGHTGLVSGAIMRNFWSIVERCF